MKRPKNEQVKPIIMAIGAAALAAVATMFVPTGLIESITGATGISELIPATGAPLGAKAKALMAFFAGAATLMIAMAYLMRSNRDDSASDYDYDYDSSEVEETHYEPGASLLSKLQSRMSAIKIDSANFPKMPWAKRDDDILDLADLPKLRETDAHSDAPVRRPISALSDLGEASLMKKRPAPLPSPALSPALSPAMPSAEPETPVLAPLFERAVAQDRVQNEPVVKSETHEEPVAAPILEEQAAPLEVRQEQAFVKQTSDTQLNALVAKLESAIQKRKQHLEALLNQMEAMLAETESAETQAPQVVQTEKAPVFEMTAAQIVPPESIETRSAEDMDSEPTEAGFSSLSPLVTKRPPLEAVPSMPRAQEEEMDAALNAALQTLQRMNAQMR
jgi:hypothetical protein